MARHLAAETARAFREPRDVTQTIDRRLASPALGDCEFTDPRHAVASWLAGS